MANSSFETLEDVRDVDSVRNVRELIDDGVVDDYDAIRHVVKFRSRDNTRTPVQWDDSPNAGFTDGDPWLPVNGGYREVNVARERSRSPSVLSYYRRLIELRGETPPPVSGAYELHYPDDDQLFVYTRPGPTGGSSS